jgi:hypothetical protein
MPDLLPDEARALARLMVALHQEFRARHNLPPVPSPFTLPEHLRAAGTPSLVDPRVLESSKPLIGALLKAPRALLWGILKPLFYRQAEINRDLILALEALTRDSEARRAAHHVLSARIAELEALVSRE